jgi:uncharacterized membrane protein HdeD (DUF308 family)
MREKKVSTMKIWGMLSWGTALLLTGITVYGCITSAFDVQTLLGVCGMAWVEVGVFTGAYAFKEKAENKQKIAVGLIKDLADEYGIDSLAPIIQAVIEE